MKKWAGWVVADARPADCAECNALDRENGREPSREKCAACSMPLELSHINHEAWEIWQQLDAHGRAVDTMSGYPLALRVEAIDSACSRHHDPEGLRWRLIEIDAVVVEARRKAMERHKKSRE